jgi:hypothetical protein
MLDIYRQGDASDLRDALEELLGPESASGWSTGGVYLFWHPVTRKPLYVGIAGDFPIRFAQHNGLRSAPASGCKREQIARYFAEEHDELGFTVITLSSLSQPSTARQRDVLDLHDRDLIELNEALSAQAVNEIRALEGRLIAESKTRFAEIPAWNTAVGRLPATPPSSEDGTLALAVGVIDSLLQSRKTIRELAANNLWALFETQLHGARIMSVARAAKNGRGFRNDMLREDLDANWGILDQIRDEIKNTKYLDSRCPVTVGPVCDPP